MDQPATNISGATAKSVLPESILRVLTYQRRHGFRATLGRAATLLRRSLAANRMVLYYYDFADYHSPAAGNLPERLVVERKDQAEQIDLRDWHVIMNFWNPELCRRNVSERFQMGASLWLIRSQGQLAGYGWTMTGRTIAPHYCPLGDNDVHFFDFLVFPEFRGRQINPSLVNYMLGQFAAEGRTRAYIEVAEWNQPQLTSLRRTDFHLFGKARKTSLFGRTYVEWTAGLAKQGSPIAASPTNCTDARNNESLVSR